MWSGNIRRVTGETNYSFANTAHVIEISTAVLRFSLRSSLAGNVDLCISNGNLNEKH